MGGCCSKCGNYLLGGGSRDAQGTGGDTPKLSRLQHKQSFNSTPASNSTGNSKPATNGHATDPVDTPRQETMFI